MALLDMIMAILLPSNSDVLKVENEEKGDSSVVVSKYVISKEFSIVTVE